MRLEESKHSLSRERGNTVRQFFFKANQKMILIFGSLIFSIEAKGYWEKKLQGDINELYRFDFQFSFKYKKLRLFLSLFSSIDEKNI